MLIMTQAPHSKALTCFSESSARRTRKKLTQHNAHNCNINIFHAIAESKPCYRTLAYNTPCKQSPFSSGVKFRSSQIPPLQQARCFKLPGRCTGQSGCVTRPKVKIAGQQWCKQWEWKCWQFYASSVQW